MIVAAVDVGGTRTKAAAVDGVTGAVVSSLEPVASGSTWAEACDTVDGLVSVLRARHALDGVALAVPGIVEQGRIVSLPGKFPGAEGADVAAWAAGLLDGGAPAVVVNDAVAAGIGEAVVGAGRGRRRLVSVTLGTGVGVCVVEHGAVLGAGPYGGGILGGQLPLPPEPGAPPDTAGRHDTIEARCRADALVHLARRAGGGWETAVAVAAAAGDGDPAAVAAVASFRTGLVDALVALTAAHAPDLFVVGGGLAESAAVVGGLTAAVGARLGFGATVEVVASSLGLRAALVGAAILAGRAQP